MGVLATVGGVAVQAWLSRIVRAEEQGTVQGALTGMGAAAESVVPVPAGAVFAWSLFAWSLSHASPGLVLARGGQPGGRARTKLHGRWRRALSTAPPSGTAPEDAPIRRLAFCPGTTVDSGRAHPLLHLRPVEVPRNRSDSKTIWPGRC
ncbi:hypothetical protein [Micromonospora humidisoli]|uniref:Uncharacterized protein n=1 Tax=Micromonospora humidisoli TaxID=2807622 RepID=A0ABS2J7I1_9ACTN|nr:hypothetical protein [Micromonospora humidisoli]MBM7081511.1 hypothetical protein [Micromonospora humidisoli]